MDNTKTAINLRVSPTYISWLVQIFEGHSHIGVISTVDAKNGIVSLQVTPDTYPEAQKILEHLPIEYTILD